MDQAFSAWVKKWGSNWAFTFFLKFQLFFSFLKGGSGHFNSKAAVVAFKEVCKTWAIMARVAVADTGPHKLGPTLENEAQLKPRPVNELRSELSWLVVFPSQAANHSNRWVELTSLVELVVKWPPIYLKI